jgi:hypothetical protein
VSKSGHTSQASSGRAAVQCDEANSNRGSKAFGVEVAEVEAEVAAVGRVGAS